jgi:hypothetical protein
MTGPENVPENKVPLGIPFEPLPVMVKVPPPANVAPADNEPLVRAPVVNVTLPRLVPAMSPPPFKPFTTTSVDPVRLIPALEPDRVPPLLLKSTLLEAVAVLVRVKQESTRVAITARPTDFIREAPSRKLATEPNLLERQERSLGAAGEHTQLKFLLPG